MNHVSVIRRLRARRLFVQFYIISFQTPLELLFRSGALFSWLSATAPSRGSTRKRDWNLIKKGKYASEADANICSESSAGLAYSHERARTNCVYASFAVTLYIARSYVALYVAPFRVYFIAGEVPRRSVGGV